MTLDVIEVHPLSKIVKSPITQQRVVDQARINLCRAEGLGQKVIAWRVGGDDGAVGGGAGGGGV
jgi:hypothetical protein